LWPCLVALRMSWMVMVATGWPWFVTVMVCVWVSIIRWVAWRSVWCCSSVGCSRCIGCGDVVGVFVALSVGWGYGWQ